MKPLSDTTISRKILDLTKDINDQLIDKLKSKDFSLQLDEATDNNDGHLIYYVRFIDGGVFHEDLFSRTIKSQTRAVDLFQMLDFFITENNLMWEICCGICTEGVCLMSGCYNGLQALIKRKALFAVWTLCIIHREALASKSISPSLDEVLQSTIKIVNFIKTRPLKSRCFEQMCVYMGAEHTSLLYYCNSRWLSRGNVVARVFELRKKLHIFLLDHHEYHKKFEDTDFLTKLTYLSPIFFQSIVKSGLYKVLRLLYSTIFNLEQFEQRECAFGFVRACMRVRPFPSCHNKPHQHDALRLRYGRGYFVKVNAEKKFTVTQHLKTNKHEMLAARRKVESKSSEYTQQLFTVSNKKSVFSKDLCKALMTANIPVHKISNTEFRNFLEKYTLHAVPSERNKIWVSIDETTDVEGRYIANVVVGTLLSDGPGKIFLLTTEVLEKANYSTITKLFDNAMFLLWPNAHGLHRVAEEVRVNYRKVDKLVSSVKQIFLKAPSRTVLFKTVNPGIPLPPEPILTRWRTWIEATSYYCKYFNKIRDVVRQLDPIDAVSIKKAQNLVNQRSMEPNLIFIDLNYGFLPTKIKQLETQGVKLSKTIKEITQTKKKIEEVSSEVGVAIQKKLRYVLEKKSRFRDYDEDFYDTNGR
ncbi:hypothetical protein QTP88_021777 [Uroleucon formosanum]